MQSRVCGVHRVDLERWLFWVVSCGVFTSGSGQRGLRKFAWKHHTNGMCYGLSVERAATNFIWREPCAVFCPPGGTESGDQARCTLSVVRHPDESLGAGLDLCERDRQCQNTLGGYHASGCEFDLETPPDHYWIPGRRNDNKETNLTARRLY